MFIRIGIAGVLILISLHWMLLMDTQQKQSYTFDGFSESEVMLRNQLEAHVGILGSGIEERNMWRPIQMAATVDYIKASGLNRDMIFSSRSTGLMTTLSIILKLNL